MLRLASLACALALSIHAETAVELLEKKTLSRIAQIDAQLDGVLGVAAIDLVSGRVLVHNAGTVFPQASSIKIPILVQLFRDARAGRLRLDEKITLTAADAVGGSGHLRAQLEKGAVTLTLFELATAMMETSDNTATNRIMAAVGRDRVNRLLDELGFANTRLQRIMMDTAAAGREQENVSTPMEMARLVEKIYRSEAAHAEDCSAMVGIMKRVKAEMREAVPAAVDVASKPGSVPGVAAETGIVFLAHRPFVLSVMSTFLGEKAGAVRDVTRVVYSHFERLAHSNRYGNRWR
ncbi:MAG: serine hydrolase [Bryobacteraceae bacterium]|nr:serine hydrolase [Bryobacteraceae bacterium]